MSDARSRGSKSIYQGKTTRVQGVLTDDGAKAFEEARKALAASHGLDTASDGDTIEYLAFFRLARLVEIEDEATRRKAKKKKR